MDGINEILRAEAEAEQLRKAAAAEAAALLETAELYRSEALEKARKAGDQEAKRLMEAAGQRARQRLQELAVVAELNDSQLEAEGAEKLDAAAAWLAERIAEF